MRLARVFTVFVLLAGSAFIPSAHVAAEAAPQGRYGSVQITGPTAARAAASAAHLPWRANMIGLSWLSADSSDTGVTAESRVLDVRGWSDWLPLEVQPDEGPDPGSEPGQRARTFTLPRWVGTVGDVAVRVRSATPIRDVRLEIINTLGDAEPVGVLARTVRAIGRVLTARRLQPAEAAAQEPAIITRAQWGADESWRDNEGPGYASRLELAIVHHTAGSNSYSRAEAPAVIRGIYSYHTHGRGYSDIAYNFLVDRFGRIYEGRAGGIESTQIGAHAGGFNTYSTGIALLGTFTYASPSKAMMNALVALLAWKLDVHHVPPIGTVVIEAQSTASRYDEGDRVRLNRIAAHRHTNATTCPGGTVAERLSSIRQRVDAVGHPKIYLPSLSAPSIRPSAAGVDATVTVSARFSRTVDWTWRVADAGGSTMVRLSGSGTRLNRVWNGTGFGGALLPPGRYTWRLDALRPTSGRIARGASGTIDVLAPHPRGCGGCFVSAPAADFDGDGASDLAVGVPGKDVAGLIDAGAVNVLYGSAGEGLTATGNHVLTAESLGLAVRPGDGFGSALAAGNFDGDAYDDLAIGIPRADVSGRSNAGSVAIVKGSESGLDMGSAVVFHQDVTGVDDASERGDAFGAALAAGDLTRDGRADLAIGAPGEDVGTARDGGVVTVLIGSSLGLVVPLSNTLWQDLAGVPGASESWDRFGAAITTGDVNGDERGDMIVGVPGEAIGSVKRAGAIHVFLGSDLGPVVEDTQIWSRSAVSTGGGPAAGDEVAFALVAADVDADGYDDVVAGVPGEDVGSSTDAGAIVVLVGSESGIVTTGEKLLHRGLVELGADAASGDGFGSSLAAGDFNGDDAGDVAIGIPGDDVPTGDAVIVDAGSMMAVNGSFETGLLALGSSHWHLGSEGVIGAPARGDLFGWGLGSGDFDADGFDDVVVAIPGRDLGGAANAGSARVLYGSVSGVSGRDQRWDQAVEGVRGTAKANDLFGAL